MDDEKILELLRQDIKELRKEIQKYRENMYQLPCKEIQAKVSIMWKGFFILISANVSLVIKIIFDHISK